VPLHLAAPCDDGRAIEVNTPNALVGQRVLLVNDVVTTGAGMRALAGVVESAGGEVAGAAWFASRSPVDVEVMIAAPAVCVVALALAAYAADECEFCRDGGAVERAVDLN
jgi:orotate phosphoribosyltransferase